MVEEALTVMAAFFGENEIWTKYEGDGREPVILVGVRELNAKEPARWNRWIP